MSACSTPFGMNVCVDGFMMSHMMSVFLLHLSVIVHYWLMWARVNVCVCRVMAHVHTCRGREAGIFWKEALGETALVPERLKHASEIVARSSCGCLPCGALGNLKTLTGNINGVQDNVSGGPFTLIVPDESVSNFTLTDSLILVGRLKEGGFDVIFRIPADSTDGFMSPRQKTAA